MDLVHLGPVLIRKVWSYNLHSEFELIRRVINDHPYVGLGTMFPGPTMDIDFDVIVQDVNELKVLQFGLTFMSANFTLPCFRPGIYCIWQFNFRDFNGEVDDFEPDSIQFLRNRGINFDRLREDGASVAEFARLLRESGAVMNRKMRWLAFQGGYAFGFLIKALSGGNVPTERAYFHAMMGAYFPIFYDVKHITTLCGVDGGLETTAEQFGVYLAGNEAPQTGWDSLLACCLYLQLRRDTFGGSPVAFCRVLYLR